MRWIPVAGKAKRSPGMYSRMRRGCPITNDSLRATPSMTYDPHTRPVVVVITGVTRSPPQVQPRLRRLTPPQQHGVPRTSAVKRRDIQRPRSALGALHALERRQRSRPGCQQLQLSTIDHKTSLRLRCVQKRHRQLTSSSSCSRAQSYRRRRCVARKPVLLHTIAFLLPRGRSGRLLRRHLNHADRRGLARAARLHSRPPAFRGAVERACAMPRDCRRNGNDCELVTSAVRVSLAHPAEAPRLVEKESAGMNRHGVGDGNALHRRGSDPRWPRVMRWRSVRAQRSVDRGRAGGVIEPRNPDVRGADALFSSGRQHRWRRYRESLRGPARSKNPGTHDELHAREPGDPVVARGRC